MFLCFCSFLFLSVPKFEWNDNKSTRESYKRVAANEIVRIKKLYISSEIMVNKSSCWKMCCNDQGISLSLLNIYYSFKESRIISARKKYLSVKTYGIRCYLLILFTLWCFSYICDLQISHDMNSFCMFACLWNKRILIRQLYCWVRTRMRNTQLKSQTGHFGFFFGPQIILAIERSENHSCGQSRQLPWEHFNRYLKSSHLTWINLVANLVRI